MFTATKSVTLPVKVEAKIRSTIADSFMLPTVAMQAIEIAKDPDCRIGAFTTLVERDVKLASEIIALANTAVYGGGAPISSLHQAVVRLGFRHCRNLIVTASLSSLKKKLSFQDEWTRECLWRHGFLTALLCLNVNRLLGLGFQGEEFTAGLVHDFGRTLLAAAFPINFRQIDSLEFNESADLLFRERAAIGTDHCEVGKWFAIANQLPDSLLETIGCHHLPGLASRGNRSLVGLTSVCDHMANYLQRHGSPAAYIIDQNDAVPFLAEATGINVLGHLKDVLNTLMNTVMEDAEKLIQL